jgi:hypothetical protein
MITGEEGSDHSGKTYVSIELVKTTMTQPEETI